MSYPAGWIARAATAPYPEGTFYSLAVADPRLDVLHDPVLNDHLFLRIASQSVGDSSPEDWVAAQMAGDGSLGCTITEPITVDGATGLLGVEGCDVAVVATADRGYWIAIHASGDPQDVAPYDLAPYDRAWFEEVLATVQFRPEDAVDAAPSTTP